MVLLDTKESRIVQIIGELIEQRREYKSINFKAVAARYPELMPDLAIRFAAVQAREAPAQTWKPADGDQVLFLLGDAIADMENIECLDQGAQGHVYRAWHRPTKREVAIKILLNGPASSMEQRRRFRQEVELVARLRHPNIVSVYDSGEASGYSFIVMEYIPGLRIDDFVCVEQLTVKQIVSLFCTICDAVHFAHQNAVLHRDLKPSNLLVDSDGKPHVLDFGLAKDIEANTDHSIISLTGQVVGTLPYLSPDQVRGEPASIQTDVYSLGVILFELLTGEYPYPIDDNRFRSLSNIVTRDPVSPRKMLTHQSSGSVRPSDINRDLERIALKALAKEPHRRYGSAAALADDLRRYLKGDAVFARSASRVYVLGKTVRRYRTLFIALLACIGVLSVALVAVTAAWRKSDHVAKLAMTGLEMASQVKVGSVDRDAGRLDDAARLYETVVAIAQTADADDPVVMRQLYNAHQRLGDLCFERKEIECASSHMEKAYDLAHLIGQRYPDHPVYQGELALILVGKGRVMLQLERYEESAEFFIEASRLQEHLLAGNPENPSLNGDYAYTLRLLGSSARKQGLVDDAAQIYSRALRISQKLSLEQPLNLSRSLDLLRAESKMVIVHLSAESQDHDAKAGEWLDIAESHLAELKAHEDAAKRMLTIDEINYEIGSNRQILSRRLASRSNNP